jgi:phage gpG-like protein
MAQASIKLNTAAIKAQITGPSGMVAKEMMKRGNRVQNKAKQLCPTDGGRLKNSITLELRGSGDRMEVRVGTNVAYAVWVHEGTGIYAGRGYITPKRGRFLSWKPRGGARVFARKIKGQKAQPFLKDALPAARR